MMRLITLSLLFALTIQPMNAMESETKTEAISSSKSLLIGLLSGCGEVALDQPLIGLKNWLQLPRTMRKQIPLNLKTVYRGLGVNLAGMGPATSVQMGINSALNSVIRGDELESLLARAALAGACSTAVATPIELMIVQQQIQKCSAAATFRTIWQTGGLKSFMRGALPVAARESLWAQAYLVLYPLCTETVESHAHDMVDKVFPNSAQSTLIKQMAAACTGGVITGAVVATLTHPLDTIKTRMQADYAQVEIKSIRDSVQAICKEVDPKTKKPGGVKNLYNGLSARATRAMIAIPVLVITAQWLTSKLESNRESQNKT